MFENFFGKSRAEKEKNPERVIELGTEVLQREANLEIEPKRSGGYMLCTVLAMVLAMGVTAEKAKAQIGGWANFGRQTVGSVISESGSAVDRTQNAKQDKIEREYIAQLTRLEDDERQLDYRYSGQKNRLMQQGGPSENLKNLENDYRAEKAKISQVRAELKKEHDRQIRNIRTKKTVAKTIFQGVRGW